MWPQLLGLRRSHLGVSSPLFASVSLHCKSLMAAGGFFFHSRLNTVEKSKGKACSQLWGWKLPAWRRSLHESLQEWVGTHPCQCVLLRGCTAPPPHRGRALAALTPQP